MPERAVLQLKLNAINREIKEYGYFNSDRSIFIKRQRAKVMNEIKHLDDAALNNNTHPFVIPKGTRVFVSDDAFHLHPHVLEHDRFYDPLDIVHRSDKFVFGCTAVRLLGFRPTMDVQELREIDYITIPTANTQWPYIVFGLSHARSTKQKGSST